MNTKELYLLIIEEEKPLKKPFIEIVTDILPPDSYITKPNAHNLAFWKQQEQPHTPHSLASSYLKKVKDVSNLFHDIFKGHWSYENICKTLLEAPVTYACPEAYKKIRPVYKKENEEDAEFEPVAHFDVKEGIIISLEQKESSYLECTIAHEFGHYLHHRWYPERFTNSDPTMKEIVAIFVQEQLDHRKTYREKTLHSRAQQILTQTRQNRLYQSMTTAEQWNFLVYFTFHGALRGYLEGGS